MLIAQNLTFSIGLILFSFVDRPKVRSLMILFISLDDFFIIGTLSYLTTMNNKRLMYSKIMIDIRFAANRYLFPYIGTKKHRPQRTQILIFVKHCDNWTKDWQITIFFFCTFMLQLERTIYHREAIEIFSCNVLFLSKSLVHFHSISLIVEKCVMQTKFIWIYLLR